MTAFVILCLFAQWGVGYVTGRVHAHSLQNAATVGDAPAEGPARRAAQDDPNLPPMEGGS